MVCALRISSICIIFRQQALQLMNVPTEAFSQALGYATITASGLVFIYGYNIVSAILRGMGDSKHPFVFISLAAVMNLILDLIFVAGFRSGAAGAALATVISQGSSFLCCAVFLLKHKDEFELNVKLQDFFHWDKDMLADLIKLGTPMAIKSAAVPFSILFVNSWINSYGVAVSAFAGVANKFSSIANLISNAINNAGSSMVGQNIAAQQFARVKKIILTIFAITSTVATLFALAVWKWPMEIFSIFTQDENVLRIALDYVPIAALMFCGSAARSGMNALINGSGNYV